MNAVLPILFALIYQAEVSFMDECCGLKRMVGTLSTQVASSQSAKVIIQERQKLTFGSWLPLSEVSKQTRDFASMRIHGIRADFNPVLAK